MLDNCTRIARGLHEDCTYLVNDLEKGQYYLDTYKDGTIYREQITQEVYEAIRTEKRKENAKN